MKSVLTLFFGFFLSLSAAAISVDWGGTYRLEMTEVDSTSLAEPKNKKSYILQGLTLSPKIIAVDGVNIVGQFQVFSNSFYPGSQTGMFLGGNTSNSANRSRANGRDQGSSSIEVRQLYLNINQEFGSFLAGRAPVQFGTGMTFNAGNGAFDHWGDTYDLVAGKFIIGNFSMMPMIAKPYAESVALGKLATDIMFDATYSNPETESTFGLFRSERTAGQAANDVSNVLPGSTITGDYKVKSTNVYVARGWESFKVKLEAGFQEGQSGASIAGEEVKFNGYGIVTEMQAGKDLNWKLKMGLVSGDNPNTNSYEGFHLDRNYDLGFLLFNHVLGGYDVFRTALQRSRDSSCVTAPCAVYQQDKTLDEETVSNVFFINPSHEYKMNDRWSWRNAIVFAQLQNAALANGSDASRNVGFELDTALIYKPHERITWVNEIGALFPGAAFAEGSANRDVKTTFGFQSKAAISF